MGEIRQDTCPLCNGMAAVFFQAPKEGRSYYHCSACDLRFLSSCDRLSSEDEEAYYRLHENRVDDVRYQDYVRPLYNKVNELGCSGQSGLDYGCGAGPVLTHMLQNNGFLMTLYDPFFCSERSVLSDTYDFIICSEVVEHFHNPRVEFLRLRSLLREGGFLAVMSGFYSPSKDFASWYYRRDPTHVSFYSVQTLQWIAKKFGYSSVWTDESRVAALFV